jgi:hypothetical protein
MKKLVAALALVAILAMGASAKALMIAPQPVPMRLAAADAVVVAKVSSVAEKAESADMFKGDTRQMKVATLTVEDTVFGKKGKTVKVGFFPPTAPPPGRGGLRPAILRYRGLVLSKDQEGMFFLTRHPTKKDVYVVQGPYDFVTKPANPSFTTEANEARKAAKLLADPNKGLDSKDAKVRLETAAILIQRYRTASAGGTKTVKAPSDLSKKILTTLAEADWTNTNPRNYTLNPQSLFLRLNVTAKDGWTPPTNFALLQEDAKKWLKAHASKYRIERYVREGDKKPDLEPEPE